MASGKLLVPCAYQGGKQRVAGEIVAALLQQSDASTVFYDLCCGSGAISLELVNQGVSSDRIIMADLSSWGAFWSKVGLGCFDLEFFQRLTEAVPEDKHQVKGFMTALATSEFDRKFEAEYFLLLQACSFGGKQIWFDGERWHNACFRSYWQPTATSVRRSPANPMQPAPAELFRRVKLLTEAMAGVTCHRQDVRDILKEPVARNSIVYVDPPYAHTTGYACSLDVNEFVQTFKKRNPAVPLLVSEGKALTERAVRLNFRGAKGGISGVKAGRHEEWLSFF